MRKDELPHREIRGVDIRTNTHSYQQKNPGHQTETIKRTISRLIAFIIANVEFLEESSSAIPNPVNTSQVNSLLFCCALVVKLSR
jgi:hypothetical protein